MERHMTTIKMGIRELKSDLSGMINQVAYGGKRIIVTSRGKPKAALIGIEDLRRLEKEGNRQAEKWQAWLAHADALRECTRPEFVESRDSVEILRELRERRTDEIGGVR